MIMLDTLHMYILILTMYNDYVRYATYVHILTTYNDNVRYATYVHTYFNYV